MPSLDGKIFTTLRVYDLRALIIASMISFGVFMRWQSYRVAILSLIIMVHHCASVFNIPYFIVVLDITLLSWEIVFWFLLQIHTWTITRWDNTTRIVAIGALYVQMVALLILWVLRAADILGHGWHSKYLFSRFNFLPSGPFITHHRGQAYFWKTNLEVTFWIKPHVISALRALFAASFILGILIFSDLALVIEPWSKTAVVPAKSLYSTDLPADVSRMEKLPVWSIIASRQLLLSDRAEEDMFFDPLNTVNVTPLWVDDLDGIADPMEITTLTMWVLQSWYSGAGHPPEYSLAHPAIKTITIRCPSRCPTNTDALDFLYSSSNLVLPDLLVTVNFTGVHNHTLAVNPLKMVHIYATLGQNTVNVLRISRPVSLLPGMHVVGRVSVRFRSLLGHQFLSSLGFIDSATLYLVAQISDLTPDPSPLISKDEDTATLRLFVPVDMSDWEFVEDYRAKSVVTGLSAVGGIWTFSNGVFTILFGGTLALALWGLKPLSAFGVTHRFWEERLRKEYIERATAAYPYDTQIEGSVMTWLLREKLVDLGPLERRDLDRETSQVVIGGYTPMGP